MNIPHRPVTVTCARLGFASQTQTCNYLLFPLSLLLIPHPYIKGSRLKMSKSLFELTGQFSRLDLHAAASIIVLGAGVNTSSDSKAESLAQHNYETLSAKRVKWFDQSQNYGQRGSSLFNPSIYIRLWWLTSKYAANGTIKDVPSFVSITAIKHLLQTFTATITDYV